MSTDRSITCSTRIYTGCLLGSRVTPAQREEGGRGGEVPFTPPPFRKKLLQQYLPVKKEAAGAAASGFRDTKKCRNSRGLKKIRFFRNAPHSPGARFLNSTKEILLCFVQDPHHLPPNWSGVWRMAHGAGFMLILYRVLLTLHILRRSTTKYDVQQLTAVLVTLYIHDLRPIHHIFFLST